MKNILNKHGITIIIACSNANNLKKAINDLLRSKIEHYEVIIGYDSDRISEDEIKSCEIIITKNKINTKFVNCKKNVGKYETILSNNEIYIQCEKFINYEYVVLTADDIEYSHGYFNNVIKSINPESDFVINSYTVLWKEGNKTLYTPSCEKQDSEKNKTIESVDFNKDIIYSFPNKWWMICTNNKIYRSDFIRKNLLILKNYYDVNTAHLELDDLMLSMVSFKSAKKISFNFNNYTINTWKSNDFAISDFYRDINVDYFVNEIIKVFDFICKVVLINDEEKKEFNEYFNCFLGKIIWRHDWIATSLKDKISKVFANIVPFGLESFGEYGTNILESDEIITNDKQNIGNNINVKIYVSMHKNSYYPNKSKIIVPIQVGTSLSEDYYSNMIHDNDASDNISKKNKMYCELTSQYYVWKNVKNLDYYGFWHYRRYFSFNKNESNNDYEIIYHNSLNDKSINESSINDDIIKEYCGKYDIILPRKTLLNENGKIITVYEQWSNHFNKADIDTAIDVVTEQYPEYLKALLEVMNSTSAVFCNMFIMDRKHFNEYSKFCFDVLFEVEKRIDQERYNIERYRTLGHIAERLLAVYITYLEKYSEDNVRIYYALKIQYEDTKPCATVKHPGMNNCISIMLACDDKYMKYTNVLLESIKENATNSNYYDVVICHRGITELNQNISKSIFQKTDNIQIRFADVTRNFEKFTNLHIDRHLSLETYYRFLVLDIFKEYERVLYLDCDMVVNSDPAELFFTEMNDDQYIAAVRDYDFIAAAVSKDKEFYHDKILRHIKIDKPENYFQAGMILFNLKNLIKHFTSAQLFETALSRNWFFHDQDVLNCLFNGHVKFVDDKWNVFSLLENNSRRKDLLFNHLPARFSNSYQKSLSHPAIIHYAGVPKVWNESSVHLGYLFWKYARNSPYYEMLNNVLVNGEGDKTGWILFITPNQEKTGKATHFFSIRSANDAYVSNYCVIDFIFMSNHSNISTNTLIVNYSLWPHDRFGLWTKVIDFKWTDPSGHFSDINYIVDDSKFHGLNIHVNQQNQYEGFSFKVRELASRSLGKPYIKLENSGFIN